MKTVLVVDDVAFVRKTLSDLFTKARYHVVGEATDGNDAVEKYKQLRPDLVTMDVAMPKQSGIEATRRIMKMDPAGKILIISALGQESLIMEAINAGAKDYVLKPFTASDVLKAAEHILIGHSHKSSKPSKSTSTTKEGSTSS